MEPGNFFFFFLAEHKQLVLVAFKSNWNHHIYTIYTFWIRCYCLLISFKGAQTAELYFFFCRLIM